MSLEAWDLPKAMGSPHCLGEVYPCGFVAHLLTCYNTSHIDKPNTGCSVHHLQGYPHEELQHHVESQVFYPI